MYVCVCWLQKPRCAFQVTIFESVCVQFVGGEPHTVGPSQASVALIRARLHMDLIDWEIII